MSDQSKRIADTFGALKDKQHAEHAVWLKKDQQLDEGFSRLREELDNQLRELSEELNHEPKVGNILSFASDEQQTQITRTDTGAILTVKYDSSVRTATLNSERPVKFHKKLEVKPKRETGWYYANEGSAARMDYVAQVALKALLGIS